jgi:hypothetical protein
MLVEVTCPACRSVATGLDHSTAQAAAASCAGARFLLMGVGAWFGGRLVYEFWIAVKEQRDPKLVKN